MQILGFQALLVLCCYGQQSGAVEHTAGNVLVLLLLTLAAPSAGRSCARSFLYCIGAQKKCITSMLATGRSLLFAVSAYAPSALEFTQSGLPSTYTLLHLTSQVYIWSPHFGLAGAANTSCTHEKKAPSARPPGNACPTGKWQVAFCWMAARVNRVHRDAPCAAARLHEGPGQGPREAESQSSMPEVDGKGPTGCVVSCRC